ncbi:hypothetical protein DV737_g2527, partial [Chaetothyriales sp. CBS 132003]
MSLTFSQGFFLGQLSVVLLLGAFLKFFIFGEAPAARRSRASSAPASAAPAARHVRAPSLHSMASSKTSPHQSWRNQASSNVLKPVSTNATETSSILRKTYYQMPNQRGQGRNNNHSSHQPESLDWFNVLLAQTIAQYRQTAYNIRDGSPDGPPSVLTSLEAAINDPDKRPSFLDQIKITEISMGEEYPIFSNVRVVSVNDDDASPAATGGRLQALVDVDLSDDNLTLAIETSLILNYPKPFSALLPVALSLSVVRFSGTLSISFVPATEEPTETNERPSGKPKTNLAFSFLPDYRLDLSVRSLIGSRSRLQDIPKIAQLVEARVQAWFEERVVEPRVQVAPLPGLWPRMGKTRMREGKDDERSTSQGRRMSERTKSDNFPSQQGTEQLFEGLRMRSGPFKQRSDSQVIIGDEDIRLPGALSI